MHQRSRYPPTQNQCDKDHTSSDPGSEAEGDETRVETGGKEDLVGKVQEIVVNFVEIGP